MGRMIKAIKTTEAAFNGIQTSIQARLKQKIRGYNATKYAEPDYIDSTDGKYLIFVGEGSRLSEIQSLSHTIVEVDIDNIEYVGEDE